MALDGYIPSHSCSLLGRCFMGGGKAVIDDKEIWRPASPAPARYIVDSSAVEVHGRRGVQYRHSKSRSDKVKSDIAFWGEVVEGFCEDEDWLKVGRHYLPMKCRGKQVIFPVLENPLGRLSSKFCNAFAATERPAAPMEIDAPAAPCAPEDQGKATVVPQLRQPWFMKPSVGSWCQVHRTPQAANEEHFSTERDVSAEAAVPQWHLLPSVGTWLQRAPVRRASLCASQQDAVENTEEILSPPLPPQQAIATPVELEKPQLMFFVDLMNKPAKGEEGSQSGLSPSTCISESVSTPVSCAPEVVAGAAA